MHKVIFPLERIRGRILRDFDVLVESIDLNGWLEDILNSNEDNMFDELRDHYNEGSEVANHIFATVVEALEGSFDLEHNTTLWSSKLRRGYSVLTATGDKRDLIIKQLEAEIAELTDRLEEYEDALNG